MNAQKIQIGIIVVLMVGIVGTGYGMYQRNQEVNAIHSSLVSLSDEVRQSVKQRNDASLKGDPVEARQLLQSCGLTGPDAPMPTIDDMNAVLPYLVRNETIASLINKGYELKDACTDDSTPTRILFIGSTLQRDGRSTLTFGALDEAYPQSGTVTNIPEKLGLVSENFPTACSIIGNGAHPESQFLVNCVETDTSTTHGYVLDFVKRISVEAYNCGSLQDDGCHVADSASFEANKAYYDPKMLKQIR